MAGWSGCASPAGNGDFRKCHSAINKELWPAEWDNQNVTAARMTVYGMAAPDDSGQSMKITKEVARCVVGMVNDGVFREYVCDVPAGWAGSGSVMLEVGTGSNTSEPFWVDWVRLEWNQADDLPTVTPTPTATVAPAMLGSLEYGADCNWIPGQQITKEATLLSNGSFEYLNNGWPSGWHEEGSGNWIVEQGVGAGRSGDISMAHDQWSTGYKGKYVRLGNYRLVPAGGDYFAAGGYVTSALFDGPGTVRLSVFQDLRQPLPDHVIVERGVNIGDPVWVKVAGTFTAADAGLTGSGGVDGFWLVVEAFGTNNFYVDDLWLYGSGSESTFDLICGEDEPDQVDLPADWVTPTPTSTPRALWAGTPIPPAVDTLIYPTRCWGYAGVDTSNSVIADIISDTINLGDMPTFGVCMEPQEFSLAANQIIESSPDGFGRLFGLPTLLFGAIAAFAVFEFIRNR
jgi:hypothetical protein